MNEKDTYLEAFKTVFHVLAPTAGTVLLGNPIIGSAAGATLIQIMYGIQSSVKQKRVFSFFEKFEKSMVRLQDKYDADSLDKVEIWDLVESAVLKSSRANNEAKIDRFKNIIQNHIIHRNEYDYIEKFLQIAERLTDKQVLVLKCFVDTESFIHESYRTKRNISKRLEEINVQQHEKAFLSRKWENGDKLTFKRFALEKSIKDFDKQIEKLFDKRREALNIFLEEEFHFMMAELVSYGLLYNPAQGTFGDTGEQARLSPTILAKQFIEYLED